MVMIYSMHDLYNVETGRQPLCLCGACIDRWARDGRGAVCSVPDAANAAATAGD